MLLKKHSFVNKCRSVSALAVLAVCALNLGPLEAHASPSSGSHLVPQKAISAPQGFAGLCAKYDWVCKKSLDAGLSHAQVLKLAKQINSRVNRSVPEIEDSVQYGREEYWALPTHHGGDCEDLVLLKKKLLIAQGIPSEDMLIATVLDKKLRSHAVLVLRTSAGDLVLDNLTNRIKPWQKTGYTFLKLQNPNALYKWDAVLAGGVINDRPTATR